MNKYLNKKYGIILTSLVIFTIAALFRLAYLSSDFDHPDEEIPVKVIEYMSQTGDWDTNWAKADLGDDFNYEQYNFSSYIYSVFLFSHLASFDLLSYRLFSVICSLGAIAVILLFAKKTGEPAVVIGTAFLAAIAPILVQDAHYARPEAFVTLLVLMIVYLCWGTEKPGSAQTFLAAVLTGFAVACKISLLFFIWVPFAPLARSVLNKTGPGLIKTVLLSTLTAILVISGFYLGAPYAFENPDAYVNGVMVLMDEYNLNSFRLAYSHLSGGVVADLVFEYLGATLGWVTLVLFVSGLFSIIRQRSWELLLFVFFPVLFYFGYFSSKVVFFERNFSHVIPFYLMGSLFGLKALGLRIRNFTSAGMRYSSLLAAILLLLMAATPLHVSYLFTFHVLSGKESQRRLELASSVVKSYPGRPIVGGHFLAADRLFQKIEGLLDAGNPQVIFYVKDLTDEHTYENIRKLKARFRVKEAGTYESVFKGIPYCTLHGFHSCSDRYFIISG